MKYVGADDDVKIGDRVVTSGMDRIFPKDLPIGTISQVKAGTTFKQLRVRPSASLEKLEEVIVLLTTDPLAMKSDSTAPASNATIPSSGPNQLASGAKPTEKQP
jgi:rod shape-determining protein MreC